jgi:hypothetical protein
MLKTSRDTLAEVTKRAEAHPRAEMVASLPEILTHARTTYRDLSEGVAKIAKGETTGDAAEALADQLAYDYMAALDLVTGALETMDGNG